MTAENLQDAGLARRAAHGFNEAAADDRGKRPMKGLPVEGVPASMRPRPMTAENAPGASST